MSAHVSWGLERKLRSTPGDVIDGKPGSHRNTRRREPGEGRDISMLTPDVDALRDQTKGDTTAMLASGYQAQGLVVADPHTLVLDEATSLRSATVRTTMHAKRRAEQPMK